MRGMWRYVRGKHFDAWLGGYARHLGGRLQRRARERAVRPKHLLFALCDHFEPLWNEASTAQADARVAFWLEAYPKLAARFRDADGHHPRHSFFFPGEQYTPRWLDALGDLAKRGLGEVEVHLHHAGDTEASLRASLEETTRALASHGHLSRDPATARPRYAFIHGNWCLANARRDGSHCGVDAEIPLLFDTGCYADFTFPSAPDESQPAVVNQIYWPAGDAGDLAKRRAYERGERARVGEVKRDRILMVEGPLSLSPRRALLPVWIENAGLTAVAPGSAGRVRSWVRQAIHVEGRPEWLFAKAYTHGAPELQAMSLLGDGGRSLHEGLAEVCAVEGLALHYVTAREMFNVAMAAMEGRDGDPAAYRDYVLGPPPVASLRL